MIAEFLCFVFNLYFCCLKLESKITLAIGGIAVVLSSVFCSLGFFGYLGIQTTMLTIEVNLILFNIKNILRLFPNKGDSVSCACGGRR